jgi:FtsP/CotA-like multicopper oxidase with cupredoxin domain
MKPITRHVLRIGAWLLLAAVVAVIGALGSGSLALAAPGTAEALPATTCTSPTPGERVCDLWAKSGTLTLADGTVVTIWGFSDSAGSAAQLPGPALIVNQGETVTVNLANDLAGETVSLSFPGQALIPDLTGVPAGGSTSYTFTPTEPGTYAYEAGLTNNGARQVAMGLFGALIVRPAADPGSAYGAGTSFDDEYLLVVNEIDPALNADPNGFAIQNFKADYWLINGQSFPDTDLLPTAPGNRVLLRYLNGGIRSRYVAILGLEQTVLGIDSSQLPYTYTVTSEALGSGQALDVMATIPVSATEGERYTLYNPGLQLHNAGALAGDGTTAFGGLLTFLEVSGGAALPDVGPLASNAQVAPSPTTGAQGVTLTVTLDEATTGGSNVDAWEYFIDDLGADGSGISMTVGAPAPMVVVSTAVPSTTLDLLLPGDVTFYIHGRDALGHWGPVTSAVLDLVKAGPMIQGISLSPNPTNGTLPLSLWATADDTATGNIHVVDAEFFFGAPGDDGTGFPMSLNMDPAPVVGIYADIPTSTLASLAEGPNTIYIHALDALGNWGGYGTIDLLLDESGPTATGLSLLPNPNNGTLPVNTSNNSVRLRALIADQLNFSGLAQAEGFIDYDPANDPDGSGFPFMASDALFNSTVEQAFVDIPLTTVRMLSQGPHILSFHGQDVAGNWGPMGTMTLIVDKTGPAISGLLAAPNPTGGATNVTLVGTATDSPNGAAPASNIAAAEWFVGYDPGEGFGTPMTAADGFFNTTSEVAIATINVGGWANGSYGISVRARDIAGSWGPVSVVTLNVSGNLLGRILVDGFETGSLVSWQTAVGNVSVAEAAALEGAWGLAVQLNGAEAAYVVDQTPMDEANYYASFLFNPNDADTAGSSHNLLLGLNADSTPILGIQFETGAGGPEVRGWVRSGGVETFTNWYHIANAAQQIGLAWHSAADATFDLAIDGQVVETLSGLDTTASRLEEVRLGASSGMAAGMAGAEYLDSFTSARTLAPSHVVFLPLIRR